jgi:hypothetical protein
LLAGWGNLAEMLPIKLARADRAITADITGDYPCVLRPLFHCRQTDGCGQWIKPRLWLAASEVSGPNTNDYKEKRHGTGNGALS